MDLILTQLTDPFRIVMLGALVYVWHRNHQNGSLLPLAAGWVFVAVLLPVTTAADQPTVPGILWGLLSNAVILAVVLAGRALWLQSRRG